MMLTVPTGVAVVQPWFDAGVFGPTEVHAAAVVAELLEPDPDTDLVVLAFALALWAPQHGHACIDLDTIAELVAAELATDLADADDGRAPIVSATVAVAAPDPVAAALRASAAVREVSAVDEVARARRTATRAVRTSPVYTQRQWVDECAVAVTIRRRARRRVPPTMSTTVLDRLLPPIVDGVANPQNTAANVVAEGLLTIIVGGPGTGKTHTLANLLAAELAGSTDRPDPPGGAHGQGRRARLTEAVVATADRACRRAISTLAWRPALAGLQATTVHRLLGGRQDVRTRFVHDADNLLDADLIVVDETSMIALPLIARLLAALPETCRLVLVGDPDQLRSIEVGTVLG